MRQVTLKDGWSPVKFMAPINEGPILGQQQMTVPAGMIPAQKPIALIDSAFVNFLTDAVASTSTGMLAYYFLKAGSKWGAFFAALSAATGVVGLINLSKVQQTGR